MIIPALMNRSRKILIVWIKHFGLLDYFAIGLLI